MGVHDASLSTFWLFKNVHNKIWGWKSYYSQMPTMHQTCTVSFLSSCSCCCNGTSMASQAIVMTPHQFMLPVMPQAPCILENQDSAAELPTFGCGVPVLDSPVPQGKIGSEGQRICICPSSSRKQGESSKQSTGDSLLKVLNSEVW